MRHKKLRTATMIAGIILALSATSCARGGTSETEDENSSPASTEIRFFGGASPQEVSEHEGGTLTFGGALEPSSLDPVLVSGTGGAGGTEILAIYDTLLTYDPKNHEFSPRLAESYEFSDDGMRLELKLRSGVTFTDGTPLDSGAVIASFQRHIDMNSRYASTLADVDMSAPDDATVVMEFDKPSQSFLSYLVGQAGAVVSPAAAQNPEVDLGSAPVGAGPFKLSSWRVGEELLLEPNPDYWDGAPYLDRLRFVYLGSGDASWESLSTGTIDAMVTSEAKVANRALQSGRGFIEPMATHQLLLMNTREGFGTEDVRVRKAIVHAIDPNVVNDRAFDGNALPAKQLHPEGSAIWPGEPGLSYDPAAAQALVDEVKQEGEWDGTVSVTCGDTAQERDICLTLEGQLNAVGFEVKTELTQDKVQRTWVQRDYELSATALGTGDSDMFAALNNSFLSTSPGNVTGIQNIELDAAIADLRNSRNVDDTRAAMQRAQTAIDANPPFAVLAATPVLTAWSKDVHGIIPAGAQTMRFDKATISSQ